MVDQEKIHNQCLSENHRERTHALKQLKNSFSSIPDKQQAWNDLHVLTSDKFSWVREQAAETLGFAFPHVPDKQMAWNDLHRLTSDEDSSVRSNAVNTLGSVFSYVPDKQMAWDDLHRLTKNRYGNVRSSAANALGSAFPHVPNKQKAWNDLHRLTKDKDSWIRWNAARALCSASSQVPDKQKVWNDLLRLANDKEKVVREEAADALDCLFSQIPYKQKAWNDLLKLTSNEDGSVRSSAANALCSAFSQTPDKQKAWNALLKLASNEDGSMRWYAARTLGSAFSQVPDKQRAWNDLLRLANDKDSSVRSQANYFLGKVSIFKASQAETDEDYKKELEKAIDFFEIVEKEAVYFNPAQFCLPFYRSFHTIIFKKQEAREEVNKYLKEAKSAIKGSESKKQLFEAVENLAEALKEVQNLENLDLQAMKDELSFYRKYCDHAAELMKCTDEKAPFATEVLRKGLPILDRNIKRILEEIQEKAKNTYRQSQGTVTEKIAYSVCREVQKWEIGSQEEMERYIENLIFSLKSKIPNVPENKEIYARIEALKNEKNITRQYEILPTIISLIPQVVIGSGNNPLSKKIVNSIGYSLGASSALAALSYSISGIYNLENQHQIAVEIFAFSFFAFFLIFLVIIEKLPKKF